MPIMTKPKKKPTSTTTPLSYANGQESRHTVKLSPDCARREGGKRMNGRDHVIQEWKHTAGYVPSILSRALPSYQIRETRPRFPHEAGWRRDDQVVIEE